MSGSNWAFATLSTLFEGEDHRLARLTEKIGDGTVVGAVALGGVDHPDHHVGFADGGVGHAHHAGVHGEEGLDQPGGVDKGELAVRAVDVAEDPVARGLRLVGGDGDLLADQPVQQGGLARGRTSHDGDEAGLEAGRGGRGGGRHDSSVGLLGHGVFFLTHDPTSTATLAN
jgi:hypothetical protein